MKIIYLANFRMPTERAHGVQTMKMCEAFAKAGLEVELVLPRRFTSIKANPFDYYAVTQNFRIKKLPVLDLIPLDFILGPFAFWIESLTFLLSAKFYLWFKKYDLFTLARIFPVFSSKILFWRFILSPPGCGTPPSLLFSRRILKRNWLKAVSAERIFWSLLTG